VAAADPAWRARVREAAAAVAQYGLLFGFAAAAAAVSAHGLTGFARSNMGLPGLWPYLLWGALDGAAGLCAVLLMRRAARGSRRWPRGWRYGAWSRPPACSTGRTLPITRAPVRRWR
jgi:hypothetical protein